MYSWRWRARKYHWCHTDGCNRSFLWILFLPVGVFVCFMVHDITDQRKFLERMLTACLGTVADSGCLLLLMCVGLCLSMSDITSRCQSWHTRAHTQGEMWGWGLDYRKNNRLLWCWIVTWNFGQTLSNKAIVAHCLDPPPSTVCLSDSERLGFLTSVSWHVTLWVQSRIIIHAGATQTRWHKQRTRRVNSAPQRNRPRCRLHDILTCQSHRVLGFPNFWGSLLVLSCNHPFKAPHRPGRRPSAF